MGWGNGNLLGFFCLASVCLVFDSLPIGQNRVHCGHIQQGNTTIANLLNRLVSSRPSFPLPLIDV